MTARPDLIVEFDPDDPRLVYVRGAPHLGKVIQGARDVLKQHGAEFLGEDKGGRWLVMGAAWPRVETDLVAQGFTFIRRPTTSTGSTRAVRGPLECGACGQPYRQGAAENRPCVACGAWLVLVPPHAEAARQRPARAARHG